MEQHRNLVTQHINVSTHWATALRQLILTICPEIESNQNAPAELPETETVQFVDISTKPIVLDSSVPSFLQAPNQPLPAATSESSELAGTPQMPSNDPNNEGSSNSNTDTVETNQNASKSKGRFGRILHI